MTMLDEIYDIVLDTNSEVNPASIPETKTGQRTSYASGDDGATLMPIIMSSVDRITESKFISNS